MGFGVFFFYCFHVEVGVDLGGDDGRVAEEFLDASQVGSVFDQVDGVGVAEGVGAYVFLDASERGVSSEHAEDA